MYIFHAIIPYDADLGLTLGTKRSRILQAKDGWAVISPPLRGITKTGVFAFCVFVVNSWHENIIYNKHEAHDLKLKL